MSDAQEGGGMSIPDSGRGEESGQSDVPPSGPPLTAAELIEQLVLARGLEAVKLFGLPAADDRTYSEVAERREAIQKQLLEYITNLENQTAGACRCGARDNAGARSARNTSRETA